MTTILITGSKGQLGNEMQQAAVRFPAFNYIYTDVAELDICDKSALDAFVKANNVNVIVNCAAYTAVDKAEDDVELCYKINRDAVRNIAEVASDNKVKVVHVSTDYVFDGETNLSYSEDDFTDPIGVYGASKRKGEELALENNPETVILRTSWLYSEFNKNFVKTMLHLFNIKDELGIVGDQHGQPTNANDLAEAIMQIIETENKKFGIYHFSNYPETTWFDFANKIKEFSGSSVSLKPITTEEFPTPAKRPKRSTMSLDKIEKDYGIEPKHWENSLQDCIEILKITNA